MIYRVCETTSTNDILREGDYAEGDIVWAERQTAGRGQRGHSWSSGEGLDLTFSVLLCPTFLRASEQFGVLRAAAVALTDTFAHFGLDTRIKWTNDIYAGDRKLTGVLIENRLEGDRVERIVVGIGINVNSKEFDPSLPNPTSMAAECGRTFRREEVLELFAQRMMLWYGRLKEGRHDELNGLYDSRLYALGEMRTYRTPDGVEFAAALTGTEESGRAVLRLADGTLKSFAFKEMEFVLKK